jgi:plasmid stabilization system protein ParE
MTQYAFHPDARDDLDEIWDYLAAQELSSGDAARFSAAI